MHSHLPATSAVLVLAACLCLSATARDVHTLDLTGNYTTADASCKGIHESEVFAPRYSVVQRPDMSLDVAPTDPNFLELRGRVAGAAVTLASELAICTGKITDTQFKTDCTAKIDSSITCSAVFKCYSGPCMANKNTAGAAGAVIPSLVALVVPAAALLVLV
eukprot:m51a1_g3624 hypothetical protein (162) ;mRNA; f:118138-118706